MKWKSKMLTSLICFLASAGIVYSVGVNNINMQKKMEQQQDFSAEGELLFAQEETEGEPGKPLTVFEDGVYEAEAEGYGGIIRLAVTIKDGGLSDIQVLSHNETPEYWKKASAVIRAMLEQNTVNVDSVSGATITSNALRQAVLKAMLQAKREVSGDVQMDETEDLLQLAEELEKKQQEKQKDKEKVQNLAARPSVAGSASVQTSGLKDGTYVGTGNGWNGPITVQVTIQNQKIVNIALLGHSDDSPYIDRAMSVISSILSGSGSVSTVSGATFSSRGIIDAVQSALSQAQGGGAVLPVAPSNPNGQGNGNHPFPDTNSPDELPQDPDDILPDDNGQIVVPEGLEAYYIKDKMKDGEYIGYGVGYQEAGTIKTTVTIENGEVADVKVAEQKPEYADDIDIFRNRAIRITKYLKGNFARKATAVAMLYSEYTNKIVYSGNPYETAVTLLGHQYADALKDLDMHGSYFEREPVVSAAIKGYLGNKYQTNHMFDAISGATISGSGVGKSVQDAMTKAANDYKMDNDVKETLVTAPNRKIFYVNPSKPLDLSKLVVTLVKKDGTRVELTTKDFAANGIEMMDTESKTVLTDGMNLDGFKDKHFIKVQVKHKDSITYDSFNIQFGNYSDDYVNRIEYSLDGKSWYLVEKVAMDKENPENIDYLNQVIDAPTNFKYKNIKVRVVSQSGERYEYTTSKNAGAGRDLLYEVVDAKDNSNVPNRLFVNFVFSGTEEDKIKVPDTSNPEPEKPDNGNGDSGNKNEIIVDGSVIGVDVGYSDIVEHKAIKPIKVTLHDAKATLLTEIENLPKGMQFDGKQITGAPEIPADQWDKNYNEMHKEVLLRVKAKSEDGILVREQKIYIRRDRDYDGVADYEEESTYDVFNPILTDNSPIEVNGTAPTMEQYKAKIKNLPAKGVEVVVVTEPDYTQKQTEVVLGFKVEGLTKQGTQSIKINVTKAPDKPQTQEEIIVDGSVIGVDVGYNDIVEHKAIKPIAVTLYDAKATLLTEIENLPKGMQFDGKQITGAPEIPADQWDKNYNEMHKEVLLRVKAKSEDGILVREQKIYIRRDRDYDGVADYEEESTYDVFNPILTDNSPIEVNGTAPTMEQYKAKIKNLPAKGVEVVVVTEPDYTQKQTEVVLGFKVEGLTKQGTQSIKINVTKAPDKPQTQEEIIVDGSVIGVDVGYNDIVEHKAIKPIAVTLYDAKATLLTEIENLPKGMQFDGKQITGAPEIPADQWDKNYNEMHKEVLLRVKAKSEDGILVREQKIYIRRDRDYDGVADYEEESSYDVFNPILTDNSPIEVNGTAPTMEQYKAKIKNLPAKGVEVVVVTEPDYTKSQTEVVLGFKVEGLTKQGTQSIKINVTKAP